MRPTRRPRTSIRASPRRLGAVAMVVLTLTVPAGCSPGASTRPDGSGEVTATAAPPETSAVATETSAPTTTVASSEAESSAETTSKVPSVCRSEVAEVRGTLPATFTELSGWTLSRRRPDVLWGHNDSGEGARLLAVSAVDATPVADVTVSGVEATDWEDIASYTDADGVHWLVVADTGDNLEGRESVGLVVVEEPVVDSGAVEGARVVDVVWPGGAHDVEAMLVDPRTGDVVFVGKRFDADGGRMVSVDVVPWAALGGEGPVTAAHAGSFPVPRTQPYGPTGADTDASGALIGFVYYGGLTQVWARDDGAGLVETILGQEPCSVATGFGQYEALAIADDGTLLLATEGTGVPLEAAVPAPA